MADAPTPHSHSTKPAKGEPTALASAAAGFVERAKTGRVLSPLAARALGVVLVVFLGSIAWAYVVRANRTAAGRQWAEFAEPGLDVAEFALKHKDTVAGRLARLEQARTLFGPKGVATLGGDDRAARNKGIESIGEAREAFARLAKEFAADKTLAATCLIEAADAELALVGIPKDAATADSRGTVAGAAAFLTEAAKVAGEGTPAGQKLLDRARDLEARATAILDAGQELNRRYNVAPAFTAPTPGGPVAPPVGVVPGAIKPPAVTPVAPPVTVTPPVPPKPGPTAAPLPAIPVAPVPAIPVAPVPVATTPPKK